MTLFSFDKYWNLDWRKTTDNLYQAFISDKYMVTAETSKHAKPVFAIYGKTEADLLEFDIDSDTLIMQLKSIRETGKLITSKHVR